MSSPSSSRCRQWRIHLNLFQSGMSPAEEESRMQALRAEYQSLVQKHPFPVEEEEETSTKESTTTEPSSSSAAASLDPLTAMMMEEQSKQEHLEKMDLAYRKERAKRNRGTATPRVVESEDYDETAVTLQVIDKDLQRLPVQHQSRPERVECLRQVLFVFHCVSHPHPGYRQGQHEIASYLLHALEQEQQQEDVSFGGDDHNHFAADTYALLFAILNPIQAAYDSGKEEKQPLVSLGRRILQLTAQYHPTLMRELQQKVQVPPQLYLTKWIRLLYSRELQVVENNSSSTALTEAVLSLWDFLFQAASPSSSHFSSSTTSTNNNNNSPLLTVLEAAAAARLLLHAHIVLQSEDPLHYLMNMPPQIATSLQSWYTVTMELLQHKDPPLSHVILTVPPSPASMATQQQQPQPHAIASATADAGGSSFWNTSLSKLTLSSSANAAAAVDPLSVGGSSTSSGADPNSSSSNNRPLLNSLSVGFKQTLEQAKSTTQSLSKRLSHEWEQALQQQQYAQHYPSQQQQQQQLQQQPFGADSGLQPPSSSSTSQSPPSSYNVMYRSNDALYDPPVVVSPPQPQHARISSNSNDTTDWQQAFITQATIVQSFLTHLEQEKGVGIPPQVWQAMGELHALAQQPGASQPHQRPPSHPNGGVL